MRWRRSSRLVTLGSLDSETVRAVGWLFTAGTAMWRTHVIFFRMTA
jgi:hypothetical protein